MTPPLSLYVHIPWCLHKCAYCDFNSHPAPAAVDEERYVDALLADLRLEAPLLTGRSLHSIFLGGGTPSLFSAEAIARLLRGIEAELACDDGIEITIEANPGTLDDCRFAGYRAAGVNRISLGVQSFDDGALRNLGRIHDGAAAIRAVSAAQTAGFERINIDLMFGLPGQTVPQAQQDLQQALALGVTHISRYQLTIEPGTELYRHPPQLPDDDDIADMEEAGERLLQSAGLQRYEVSAYARPGEECRHNLNYWCFGDYIGIGAGAHGKITRPDAVLRRRRLADPQRYLATAGTTAAVPESRRLADHDLAAEFMLNALRLTSGVPLELFEQRTGLALERIAAPLRLARQRQLLEKATDRIRPTTLGRRFLNDLLELFLTDPAR